MIEDATARAEGRPVPRGAAKRGSAFPAGSILRGLLLRFMAETGCRAGEAFNLAWRDFRQARKAALKAGEKPATPIFPSKRTGKVMWNFTKALATAVKKAEVKRDGDDEYAALGRALAAAAAPPLPRKDGKPARAIWPAAIQAARFLALTGWRSGAALTLRRGMLDLPRRTARLPDTKTGESVRPLSSAACDPLQKIGPGKANALVFPPSRGDGIMTGFPTVFERIAKKGGLPKDITPHILRHSFASLAADLGCSELTIATLLGHRAGSVTARCTHAADDVLLSIAEPVAAATLRKLEGERSAVVVQRPRARLVVA